MKNDNVKAIIVLFSFCLIIAVILATVNLLTAPMIEENNKKAQLTAIEGLIEGAVFEQISELDDLPETITGVFKDKNGGGLAITFATTSQYSSGDMQYAVGINSDGRITGIKEIAYMESKDFGQYPETFIGKQSTEIDTTDAFSGVTYSSAAFKSALKDAFAVFDICNDREVPQ